MKPGIFAAIALVGASGSAGYAQDATGPAQRAEPASTEPAPAPEERKVCRTERATGSLTRRTRICLTPTQWREINTRTYQGVTEMQGNASGSQRIANNPGAGG